MWVPLKKNKTKIKQIKQIKQIKIIKFVSDRDDEARDNVIFYFFYLFSLASLFYIRKLDRRNLSGKKSKVLYSMRATRGNKTRDFADFSIKNSENPMF